ncbi:MAG: hypothetical protein P9L92_20945 [Candidatus Electryonea clarkiae]|nr:hypothetical protein [Candidatus Electryonea clarkiae]MDP8285191.1 hypothetical protein [Candidatus Electryonea clarkiae]
MANINKAQAVRDYLSKHPKAKPQKVVTALASDSIEVSAKYVSTVKSKITSKKKKIKPRKAKTKKSKASVRQAKYPRHNLERALRIPRAILDQNAGRECSEKESAAFVGVQYNRGPYASEISSAIKFGLLERPKSRRIELTELAKVILRPQEKGADLKGLREAVLKAPDIADVYNHYRGENLPDEEFFKNALVDKFGIPQDKLDEFKAILMDSFRYAQLVEETGDKCRVLDVSGAGELPVDTDARIKKLGKGVTVSATDICFVMMPFAEPHGSYYTKIYEPAILKAGLRPLRADDEIFSTGKIIDQIWSGINNAKVLVAELTTRNPNVFYELGLAHALKKPVVLISANEPDVPFDLKHIRVIYYDVADPFWGNKLIDKVAENVLSALKNPEEAQFPGVTVTQS